MKSTLVTTVVALAILAFTSIAAHAHELYFKPDSFYLKPQTKEQLKLVNGTFDKNLAIVARTRMQDVSIAATGGVQHPLASDWHDADLASILTFTTGKAGTYAAGVSLRPGTRALAAADFLKFLKMYGVVDAQAIFERDNKLESVRQRAAKHVKAIVQVGDERSADYARPLGYALEIIPKSNPYDLKLGDNFSFQVLLKGQPLAHHSVYVSHAGFSEPDDAPRRISARALRTDENGVASVRIDKQSSWYIALINSHAVKEADADFETNWATLSFDVK